MQNKPKGPSWTAVILLMIFFWPVGIFFLIKKLTTDKTAIFKNSVTMFVISGFFFLFALCSVSLYTEPQDVPGIIIGIIFFSIGGILIARKGIQMRKTGHRYKRYISLIVNQEIDCIETIASTVEIPYVQCLKDLEEMISLDYFHNAYIDAGNGRIVLQNQQAAYYQSRPLAYKPSASPQPTAPTSVQCKNCGANNTINGSHGECEYCGTLLSCNKKS